MAVKPAYYFPRSSVIYSSNDLYMITQGRRRSHRSTNNLRSSISVPWLLFSVLHSFHDAANYWPEIAKL